MRKRNGNFFGNASMFEVFRPALESAGIQVADTWSATKDKTLRAARAQLARHDLHTATAARWNRATYLVAADMDRDRRTDPRVTAARTMCR